MSEIVRTLAREWTRRRLLVITEDYDAVEKVRGRRVVFIPLWKWLVAGASPKAAPETRR